MLHLAFRGCSLIAQTIIMTVLSINMCVTSMLQRSSLQNIGVGNNEGDGATGGHAGRLGVPMNAKRGLGSIDGEGAIDTGGHAGLFGDMYVRGGPNARVGLGSSDGDGATGGQLPRVRPARGRRLSCAVETELLGT